MAQLRTFVTSDPGQTMFANLKRVNADAYPDLVLNLQGIADGAQVAVTDVWLANVIIELEAAMPSETRRVATHRRPAHCSDIYAFTDSNVVQGCVEYFCK